MLIFCIILLIIEIIKQISLREMYCQTRNDEMVQNFHKGHYPLRPYVTGRLRK